VDDGEIRRFVGTGSYHAGVYDELGRAIAEAGLQADERLRFLELCASRSADDLQADAVRIEGYLYRLGRAAADDPTIDVESASAIATALLALVADAARFGFYERRLLAGAVDYFVLSRDGADDVAELRGFDDDARVVGAVCRALGRGELIRGF
jgi:hypothetical protein